MSEQSTVRDRIELNPNLTPVAIPGYVMHELCSHALDTLPEECCGLITGTEHARFLSVSRITNIMTKKHLSDPATFQRDALHAYYMAEVEYLRAQKEAESRGETVTAVYHSHIGTGAYLSREDRVYAEHPLFPFPGAAQLVLSLLDGHVEGAAMFEMDPERGVFQEGGRLLEVVES